MPAVGGDAATLETLYARYWTDLVKYINGMISDLHQAEEIAQETMLRVAPCREAHARARLGVGVAEPGRPQRHGRPHPARTRPTG